MGAGRPRLRRGDIALALLPSAAVTEGVKPSGLEPAPFGALRPSLNERPAVPKEVRGRSAGSALGQSAIDSARSARREIVVNAPITIAAPTRVRANCRLRFAPAGLVRLSGPSILRAGSIAAPATSPAGRFEAVAGDVRDPHGVREAMRGCSVVLHLAALIAIPFSFHSPDAYVDTNVKGTLNMLHPTRDFVVEREFGPALSQLS